MRTVADGAGGAGAEMIRMIELPGRGLGLVDDVVQVVALRAHLERTIVAGGKPGISGSEARYRVLNERSGPGARPWTGCDVAGNVLSLQDVIILGAVWSVRTAAAELTIGIAVVAVGAEDSSSHRPNRHFPREIQHRRQQAS